MTCSNNWTVKLRDRNSAKIAEFRPITMSLKMARTKYDFCRVKASYEVGEMLKPHTRYNDGELYGYTRAEICYDGNPIQQLVFRPDWVDYGSEFTHLQFHDLHKALADGTVDIQRDIVRLRDIYDMVLESAGNRIIDSVRYTLPDNQVRYIYGQEGARLDEVEGTNPKQTAEQDSTKRVVESDYAVDFNQISPERAIRRLNKKFRLKSWVNREGNLTVGLPGANGIRHVAAPKDERVWRYKDPNISHGREPIKKVVVEGAWEDEPGLENKPVTWFDEGGGADVKVVGIAERSDIDYGTTSYVRSSKAKKNAVADVARLTLKEEMKQQNSGTVEIDPQLSGIQESNPIDLSPGDILHLVPPDDYFDLPVATSGEIGDEVDNPDALCGGFINNEAYFVSEVEHSVTDSGQWQLFADLGMYPDVEISSRVAYFDPSEEEWFDSSVTDKTLIGTGLFEDI